MVVGENCTVIPKTRMKKKGKKAGQTRCYRNNIKKKDEGFGGRKLGLKLKPTALKKKTPENSKKKPRRIVAPHGQLLNRLVGRHGRGGGGPEHKKGGKWISQT